ncbi:cytochrome c3 family protein [Desulfobulbus sp.]|uniref:cytochrome c3 family protein n=1 Tax=Desulfobulbus sp. TaxID=895 RepID=UPI00286F106E|nr:cytochrome c3 family protein [Desulfobulbus sp.]
MRHVPICFFLLVSLLFSGKTFKVFADEGKIDAPQGYRGPDFVIIQSAVDVEQVPKPAYLPHKKHQWLDCDGCHHSKGPDGKRIDTIAGYKIEKCETCHNSTIALPVKVATLKRASHRLCMECHRQQSKELAQCDVCHQKPSNQQ